MLMIELTNIFAASWRCYSRTQQEKIFFIFRFWRSKGSESLFALDWQTYSTKSEKIPVECLVDEEHSALASSRNFE